MEAVLRITRPMVLGCMLALAPTLTYGQHKEEHGHGDIEIGKGDANELKIEFDFDEPLGLIPVDGPLLFGCALDDPGFMSIEEDEPDEGLFVIPDGTTIIFELIAIDPGLKIHTPGFTNIIDTPGEQFTLGIVPLDVHPTFHIDSTDAAWDPVGVYSFTFRLLDESGTFDPSEEVIAMVQCAVPGACCLPSGECEDGEFEELCEEEGGEFVGEASVCAPDVCQSGACCLPDGTCEEETAAHCGGEGGVFLGPDTECTAGVCDDLAAIPTTSEWGLLILGLSLLAGAKLLFRRRPVVA